MALKANYTVLYFLSILVLSTLALPAFSQVPVGVRFNNVEYQSESDQLFLDIELSNLSEDSAFVSSFSLRFSYNNSILSDALLEEAAIGGAHIVSADGGVVSYGIFGVSSVAILPAGGQWVKAGSVSFAVSPYTEWTNPFTELVWNTAEDFPPSTGQQYIDFFTQPALDLSLFVDDMTQLCPVPLNHGENSVTTNNASLAWTPVPGATKYQLKGRKLGNPGFGTAAASNAFKNVGNLDAATSYEWRLRVMCSNDDISDFTPMDTFTTFAARESIYSNYSDVLNAYPNPFYDNITVSLPAGNGTLRLMGIDGKLIKEILFENETAGYRNLNLEELPGAAYLLQIDQQGIHSSLKLIKSE